MATRNQDFSEVIAAMTFGQKVSALMNEGGYTRKEAIELLEEMGDGELQWPIKSSTPTIMNGYRLTRGKALPNTGICWTGMLGN